MESVGWNVPPKGQLELALKQSFCTVLILEGETAVAMGRMIGDGGLAYFIRDVVVHPNNQGKGYGRLVVNELLSVVNTYTPVGGYACVELMSSSGKEVFYEKLGFKTLDAINGASGMQIRIEK